VDQFGAALRLGVGANQRRRGHAAVTDLGPVVGSQRPPLFDGERGLDALLHHRRDQDAALFRSQEVVEIVIADGQPQRHGRGVEEVLGVPVRKRRRVHDLFDRAAGVLLVAGEFPGEGERQRPVEDGAGDIQQPDAFELIFGERQSQDVVGVFHRQLFARLEREAILRFFRSPLREVDEEPSPGREFFQHGFHDGTRNAGRVLGSCGKASAAEQKKSRFEQVFHDFLRLNYYYCRKETEAQ